MPLSGLPVAWASCRGRLRPCIGPERRSPLPVLLLTRSRPTPPCKANEDPQDSDRERQAHGRRQARTVIAAREDDHQIGIRPETLAAFPSGPVQRVFVTRRSEETGDGAVGGRGGHGRGRE